MVIIACVLVLLYMLKGKNSEELLNNLRDVDWEALAIRAREWIVKSARRLGRDVARPLLQCWHVLRDSATPVLDKALILGAIAYVAMPNDLVPRRVYRLFGLFDDIAVVAWMCKKVESRLTAEIRRKVESVLDEWFGRQDEGTAESPAATACTGAENPEK